MQTFFRLSALMALVGFVIGVANSQGVGDPTQNGSQDPPPTTLVDADWASPHPPSPQPLATRSPATVIPKLQVGSAGEMIGFAADAGGGQIITLIHTGKSWMSVYHIAPNGEIRLTSSRPIDADFSLELNATAPLPADIRHAVGR